MPKYEYQWYVLGEQPKGAVVRFLNEHSKERGWELVQMFRSNVGGFCPDEGHTEFLFKRPIE